MATNVKYNAITTDFWRNLDANSGKASWRMLGTRADVKATRRDQQHLPRLAVTSFSKMSLGQRSRTERPATIRASRTAHRHLITDIRHVYRAIRPYLPAVKTDIPKYCWTVTGVDDIVYRRVTSQPISRYVSERKGRNVP